MTDYQIIQKDFYRDGKKIDGQLYMPDVKKAPLVIISHGYGGNRTRCIDYAQRFASEGIAAYLYDFIGGGYDILSDGTPMEMSVLTEAEDLSIVLDGLRKLDAIDEDNIFLHGRSQGGYISTYVAGNRPDDIRGLILLYPAFVLQEMAIEQTDHGKKIDDVITFLDTTVSSLYETDLLRTDIYAQILKYKRNVLIMHGDEDDIVPLQGSIDHVNDFENAKLIIMKGGGHGFEGKNNEDAINYALQFVKENIQ